MSPPRSRAAALFLTACAAAAPEPAPAPPPPPSAPAEAELPANLDLPADLATLLAGGPWDATPGGMRIIALSHVAEGCAAQGPSSAARACLDATLRRALDLAPVDLAKPATWAGHGLYLAHLSVIDAAAVSVGAQIDLDHYDHVAQHLAAESSRAQDHHVASYPDTPQRWPADQAVVLYALHRHDEVRGTQLHDAPLAAWLGWMDAHATDPATGLWWSEVTGHDATSRLPRGCATSWTLRYLAPMAPERAWSMWATYTGKWLVQAGPLVGLREWPPGKDRPADVDSGPIMQGVGAAATAFGLSAARRVGDTALEARLQHTAGLVQTLTLADDELSAAANTLLAQAIRYEAARAP